MKQRLFEERNEARWAEFKELVALAERRRRGRARGADRDRLASFPERYRAICRDLSVALDRQYSLRLIDQLNDLALDGHRILYTRDGNFAMRIVGFVAREFPHAVRHEIRVVALATALFLLPAIAVGLLITDRPETIYSLIDAAQVQDFEAMYDPSARVLGENRDAETDLSMFGFYVWNNISIAFRAYASGLVFGLGSIVTLFFNGLQLGGVAAHLARIGFGETFFSFVIGHGAFELTAIVLSGAAGLRLGGALIAPGMRTRRAALRAAAKKTVPIVYGVFGMLVIAALLEAFWSSKGAVAPDVKYAVGTALWLLVLGYFAWPFIRPERDPQGPGE